jgi:excisionase family DNA binding protein
MHAEHPLKTYLSPKEAARYLGLSVRTLVEWRRTGRGPAYVRMGKLTGRVRYCTHELDRWMADRQHAHTAAEQHAARARKA